MLKRFFAGFFFITALIVFLARCQKEAGNIDTVNTGKNNLLIRFNPIVDGLPVQPTTVYLNYFNEPYRISQFKFYISAVDLINTETGTVHAIDRNNYFLIDAADSATWQVRVPVPPARYNQLAFIIGVDSARNVSGAQTGALDPAKGMFWTWNSGYIMAKLEGTSTVSTQPNQKFEYHVGGFKGPNNVLRRTVLVFPGNQFSEITANKKATIIVSANANTWFQNQHTISIKDKPVCTTPGELAKQIAENYSNMFAVEAISNN
jgi:hypothetical protein